MVSCPILQQTQVGFWHTFTWHTLIWQPVHFPQPSPLKASHFSCFKKESSPQFRLPECWKAVSSLKSSKLWTSVVALYSQSVTCWKNDSHKSCNTEEELVTNIWTLTHPLLPCFPSPSRSLPSQCCFNTSALGSLFKLKSCCRAWSKCNRY